MNFNPQLQQQIQPQLGGGFDIRQIKANKIQGIANKTQMLLSIALAIFNAGKADTIDDAFVLASQFLNRTDEIYRENIELMQAEEENTPT